MERSRVSDGGKVITLIMKNGLNMTLKYIVLKISVVVDSDFVAGTPSDIF
jgi:hypothetical protein